MKIGILGGTLDPIHNGHIDIALAAMSALGLDGVALMPSGNPPHKPRTADGESRLQMARLAAEGHAGLFASDAEMRQRGTTYTVDTLSTLSVERPGVEWTYIIGADALNHLDGWKEFSRVARLCDFAVVNRPGCDASFMRLRAESISACYNVRVRLLPVVGPPVSSSSIRLRVAEGLPVGDSVPPAVADYIRTQGLYLCDYGEPRILEQLKAALTPHRFAHTLGVADTAQRLAPRCGVDGMRARLAGLLHDCAKSMPLKQMQALVAGQMPDLDAQELETKAILHAPAGMVVARDAYGVRDPAILSAIRKHTLGDGDMSAMDALIYVSDFIEPGREAFPGLERARELAERDIFMAMRACATLTAGHLKACGQRIHPRTLALLEAYGEA